MMDDGAGREVFIHNRPVDFKSVPPVLISPIFGRLSDELFKNHEDLRSDNFAPARDLAYMLSELEGSPKEPFLRWLLQLLPDIKREELSHDARLQPHEVRARFMTAITQGKPTDNKRDFRPTAMWSWEIISFS
jgi:hypothetical protein